MYEVFRTFKGIEFQILVPTNLMDRCNRLVLYQRILKWSDAEYLVDRKWDVLARIKY